MDSKELNEEPLYIISVAARLADVHPQTLRIYERKGLISPARVHNRRRYSDADIEQCKFIQELTQEMGVNLAGVKMIIEMREHMEGMKDRIKSMEKEIDGLKEDIEQKMRKVRESLRSDIVPIARGDIVLKRRSEPFKTRR